LISFQEEWRLDVEDGRIMDKHLFAVLGVNITISLGIVEPTDHTSGTF
jgi:hypothetical protein